MLPNLTLTQIAALSALATALLLLPTWIVLNWGRKRKFKHAAVRHGVGEVRLEEGERFASIVSEQIEERVKEILSEQGISLDGEIDFGTAYDGSLEIWIAEKSYPSVDKIPDEKIRSAVVKAVEEFNA